MAEYVDEKNGTTHVEKVDSMPSNHYALAHENVSYGKSGLAGLAASPYVVGAAALASMGGFSFGYGMSQVYPSTRCSS